jgi:hypothetical protein
MRFKKMATPPPPPLYPSGNAFSVSVVDPVDTVVSNGLYYGSWPETPSPPAVDSPQYLLDMIRMRMRVPNYMPLPFESIYAVKSGEKVFVLVTHDGNGTKLEDGHELFPSDALITSLRLLEAK